MHRTKRLNLYLKSSRNKIILIKTNYIMKNTIITKKTGAGHFKVTVIKDHKEFGYFETTDMQLIDDIQEMNNDGFEHELIMHETFKEVIQTCLNKLS